MSHPFFSVTSFPIHRPEAVVLFDALSDAVRTSAAINLIYEQCGPGLPPLFLGQAHNLIWKEALDNLTSHGLLQTLLDRIQTQFQHSPHMQKVIRDVMNAQSAEEINIISDDVLVLDRGDLRNRLKDIAPNTNPVKVLLVRGGPKTGKSQSRHIFEQFAMDQGSVAVYLYPEVVVKVPDLIDQLFGALEAMDDIPPNFTTDPAYYRKVCVKLMEVATKKNKRLWIAVDDVGPGVDGQPMMDGEIKSFCETLASNMLNPSFRNRFRLMLIRYPEGPAPTTWKHEFWTEDRTSDTDVETKHIVELLQRWAISTERTILEDEINKLANDVVAKAEAPLALGERARPRLQRIHEELRKTLRQLAKNSQ